MFEGPRLDSLVPLFQLSQTVLKIGVRGLVSGMFGITPQLSLNALLFSFFLVVPMSRRDGLGLPDILVGISQLVFWLRVILLVQLASLCLFLAQLLVTVLVKMDISSAIFLWM